MLAFGVGSIISRLRRWIVNRHAVSSESQAHKGELPTSTPGGFRRVSFFFCGAGATRNESPRGFRAGGPAPRAQEDEGWGEDCASHSRLFYSAYPIPRGSLPPQHTKTVRVGRTSDARLRGGGLNNFAPSALDSECVTLFRRRAKHTKRLPKPRHPALRRVSFFFCDAGATRN